MGLITLQPTPLGPRVMRAMASRRSRRVLLALLGALAVAAAVDGMQLWRQQRWNERIVETGAAGATVDTTAGASSLATVGASAGASARAVVGTQPSASAGASASIETAAAKVPELQFAQAHALAVRGQVDAALNRYATLVADTPLGQAARFNSANLLLRQGVLLQAGTQPGQALASVELAKEAYRELLRHDAQYWPARYNLERAQRLVPDPEPGDDDVVGPGSMAERSATTTRADTMGQP